MCCACHVSLYILVYTYLEDFVMFYLLLWTVVHGFERGKKGFLAQASRIEGATYGLEEPFLMYLSSVCQY